MDRNELNRILDERDRKIKTDVLKQVTDLIRPGDIKGAHWANADFEELNKFLVENGVDPIESTAHNDMCTRGVMLRVVNLARKAIGKAESK